MKILPIAIAAVVGTLLLVEVGLRLFLGLGRRPIYRADADIGYLLAPNQQLRRFGNRLAVNQYSMRSGPVELERPPATLRVLLLGDSIANGAWWTDQEETISAQVEAQLRSPDFSRVEVLNASANSWGPRNQLAYLRRFGTFSSQAAVLLLNTDDLFATAPTSLPVGRDPNYPDRQPLLALGELWERWFSSPAPIPELAAVKAERGDRVGTNLQAMAAMRAIALESQALFLLAITPLLREVEPEGGRDYERRARLRLQEFAAREAIPLIDFLPAFQGVEDPPSLYRDNIHLSPAGNRRVSETLSQSLQKLLADGK